MIRAPRPEPRECLTSPAILAKTAARHGVPVVTVHGFLAAIVYRPSGEAILLRAFASAA